MSKSGSPVDAPGPDGPSVGPEREPKLWVELGVDVTSSHECPLAEQSAHEWNGSVQLVGTTCHVTVGTEDEHPGEARTITTTVSEGCLCPLLCGDGFAPVELSVDSGSLVIGAYADDRQTLSEATTRLEEGVERWRLRQLTTTANEDSVPGTVEGHVEQLTLTEKQREAVQTAVDMGYYDRPREASLGDLADRLGVTRSALSQRLNAVESKLVTDLSEHL